MPTSNQIASTSKALVYPTPPPTHSSGSTPSAALGRLKKVLSCARCRALKRKCEWVNELGEAQRRCKACIGEAFDCAGPATRAPYPRRSSSKINLAQARALVVHSRGSLSPTSSEATLNGSERRKSLTADLISHYKEHWVYRIPNLGSDWTDHLITAGRLSSFKDGGVAATLTLACAALGARSSSHSAITNIANGLSSLTLADDPRTEPDLTAVGARRAQACATLARQALASALNMRGISLGRLHCLMFTQYLLSTMEVDRETTRNFYEHSLSLFRALYALDPCSPELSGAIRTFINRDAFIALFAHSPLLLTEVEVNALCPELATSCQQPVLVAPGVFNAEATDSYATAHFLAHLRAVVKLFGSRPNVDKFGAKHRARMVELWAENDLSLDALQLALDEANRLEGDQIFVIGSTGVLWQGSEDRTRTPAQNKARLITLLTSKLSHRADIDIFSHESLLREVANGTMEGDALEVSFFMIQARERARAGLKRKAHAIENYLALPNGRHTLLAKQFNNLESTVSNWSGLALGQYGDPDGPITTEAELTDEEVEVLARGLKVAGYSYGWTAVRLQELKGGLRARREEKEGVEAVGTLVAAEDGFDGLFA